jgi:hypothetical protein
VSGRNSLEILEIKKTTCLCWESKHGLSVSSSYHFYVDVVYDWKICTYHFGPIATKENILSFVRATSVGKLGLKRRFGCYFASMLVVCGNC